MAQAGSGKHLENAQKSLDQAEKHVKEALDLAHDEKLKEKLSVALQSLHEAQM